MSKEADYAESLLTDILSETNLSHITVHKAGSQTYNPNPSDYDFVIEHSAEVETRLKKYFEDYKDRYQEVDSGSRYGRGYHSDQKSEVLLESRTIIPRNDTNTECVFKITKRIDSNELDSGSLIYLDIIMVKDINLWQKFYDLYRSIDKIVRVKDNILNHDDRISFCKALYEIVKKDQHMEQRIFSLISEKMKR